MSSCTHNRQGGKPKWLRRSLPSGPQYEQLRRLLKDHALTTVCQEAMCPNQFECYGQGTATFMILGERCTRDCRFCAVRHPPSGPPDPQEPERVAEAVALLNLRYAVVTSVTRDDLGDGGASFFAATITAIKMRSPATLVEVLIPDFQGDAAALSTVLEAAPDVLNHNIETVARLYPRVRPQADYHRSLQLLARAKKVSPHLPTKSGMMLGLGERVENWAKPGRICAVPVATSSPWDNTCNRATTTCPSNASCPRRNLSPWLMKRRPWVLPGWPLDPSCAAPTRRKAFIVRPVGASRRVGRGVKPSRRSEQIG
jgi:lipoyl synthase